MQTIAVTPWYRQAWPWLLMAPPLVAVVGGIAMLLLAMRTDDGVVAEDYYKRGLEINAEVSRTHRATELGIRGDVSIDPVAASAIVQITSASELPAEAVLRLRLVHPGRADADRVALLARSDVGIDGRGAQYFGLFATAAQIDAPVAWHVVAETVSWRVDGRVDVHELAHFTLQPGR